MNLTTLSISILLLIIIYPFVVYYQLKSFKIQLKQHWEKLKKLILKYKKNASKEVLEQINVERRAYNRVIRANEHKIESIFGKIIAKKYGFKKREYFYFKVD